MSFDLFAFFSALGSWFIDSFSSSAPLFFSNGLTVVGLIVLLPIPFSVFFVFMGVMFKFFHGSDI